MAWPANWTDAEYMTAARMNSWMGSIKAWGGNVNTSGYALIIESSAPTDTDIPANGMVVWVDETAGKLMFRTRYSNGTTLRSGEVTLAP